MGGAITAALEVVLICRACDARMAINAVVFEHACERCGVQVRLSVDRWRQLLGDVMHDAARMVENDSANMPLEAPEGTFRRVLRRERIRCLCGREATPGTTCSCGRTMSVRTLAELPHVALIDEEREVIAGERARETVIVRCPACGGDLAPDGSSRMTRCPYCAHVAQLSDDVWARLHPLRPVRRFYLAFEAEAQVAAAFPFYDASEILVDRAGNSYVSGYLHDPEGDTECAGGRVSPHVWSWTPALDLRWNRRIKFHDPKIALTHEQDKLIVWDEDDGECRVLDAPSGKVLAKEHRLPLAGTQRWIPDSDGTWLCVRGHVDVDRWTREGTEVPLFPERPTGFFKRWSTDEDVSIAFAQIALLPNGVLAVLQRVGEDHERTVLQRWDRQGHELPRVVIPDEIVPSDATSYSRLHADASGSLFLLRQRGRRGIIRIDDAGARYIVTSIAADPCMAILPSGEMFVVGSGGVIQRFAPDGRLLYENDAARKARNERLDDDEA